MKSRTKTIGNTTYVQHVVLGYFIDGEPSLLFGDTRTATRRATKNRKNLVWAKCDGYFPAVLALSKVGNTWKRHNKESLITA